MKQVGIAELKARLSEYLRAVRGGQTITVLDRDIPVAQIVPIAKGSGLRVQKPAAGAAALNRVRLPKPLKSRIEVVDLLLEERQSHRSLRMWTRRCCFGWFCDSQRPAAMAANRSGGFERSGRNRKSPHAGSPAVASTTLRWGNCLAAPSCVRGACLARTNRNRADRTRARGAADADKTRHA